MTGWSRSSSTCWRTRPATAPRRGARTSPSGRASRRAGLRWRSPTTGRASRPDWLRRSSSRGSGAPPRWRGPGWDCPSHGGSSKRTAAPWWWRRRTPGRPSWSRSRQIRHQEPPTRRPGHPGAWWRNRRNNVVADKTVVLIVEDDQNIVDLVRSNLSARGHDVIVSKDGTGVSEVLQARGLDVVLLDLMLPGRDGFELCREIRERSGVGIIVLSARRAETDKVRALNLGADDYMTKPFGIEELLARINATLRRSKPSAVGRPEPSIVRIGDVEIDLERRRVTKAGGLVHLTPTEFALLRQFAVSPGELLTHATLLRRG